MEDKTNDRKTAIITLLVIALLCCISRISFWKDKYKDLQPLYTDVENIDLDSYGKITQADDDMRAAYEQLYELKDMGGRILDESAQDLISYIQSNIEDSRTHLREALEEFNSEKRDILYRIEDIMD